MCATSPIDTQYRIAMALVPSQLANSPVYTSTSNILLGWQVLLDGRRPLLIQTVSITSVFMSSLNATRALWAAALRNGHQATRLDWRRRDEHGSPPPGG